jgi:hypothetical protein
VPLTMDREETHSLIRVEGEFNVTSAAELKNLLIEALASGQKIQLDLTRSAEIDVSLLQLLWAAEREAPWRDLGLVSSVPEAAGRAALDAGFARFPGTGDSGVSRG